MWPELKVELDRMGECSHVLGYYTAHLLLYSSVVRVLGYYTAHLLLQSSVVYQGAMFVSL
jgi:hypothetical protein